jgi:hypothetical protein
MIERIHRGNPRKMARLDSFFALRSSPPENNQEPFVKTQRLAVRTPYFIILPEYLITLGLMALLIIAFTASLADAQTTTTSTSTKRVRKSTTTITQVDEDGDVSEPTTTSTSTEVQEGEVVTTFGSRATSGTAGCKTEELNKAVIRDLKSDCKAWIKDQRADLKGKFQTSTCEESCTDCGMSLQRCNVVGTVRYRKN